MADRTGIAWTDATWNPTRGCSRVSAGCEHCYAERQAHRFSGVGRPYEGLINRHGAWNGEIRLVPELLEQPLRWRKPRRIFVNSMSDLFHEGVPDEFIDEVFAVMALAPRHTFQVLTKRPQRMREYMASIDNGDGERLTGFRDAIIEGTAQKLYADRNGENPSEWLAVHLPLPNVQLGVSVEDQPTADERILLLLDTPAAVRFVSYEPALGPVDFMRLGRDGLTSLDALRGTTDTNHPVFGGGGAARNNIDWLIVGGESGPGARPCDVGWIRSAVRQCREAGVPVFVKQMGRFVIDRNDAGFDGCEPGSWPLRADGSDRECDFEPFGWTTSCQGDPCRVLLDDRAGADPSEWPEDLRIQQFPNV